MRRFLFILPLISSCQWVLTHPKESFDIEEEIRQKIAEYHLEDLKTQEKWIEFP